MLHYSAAKLAGWLCAALALLACCVGIVASGGIGQDYAGRGSFWTYLIGPRGTQIVFALTAVALSAFIYGAVRRLFSRNRVAACCDADGVVIRTLWATRRLRWDEIGAVELHTIGTGSRSRTSIHVRRVAGRTIALPLLGVRGSVEAAHGWVRHAFALRFAHDHSG